MASRSTASIAAIGRFWKFVVLAISICAASTPAVADRSPATIAGVWTGTLDNGPNKLEIVLHVSAAQAGKISVLLDSPDENSWSVPTKTAEISGSTMSFAIPDRKIKYTGTISADGKSIKGIFDQIGPTPLVLKYEGAEVASKPSPADGDWIGLLRPPMYRTLRIALHVQAGDSGQPRAWFYTLDQDPKPYPCTDPKLDGRRFAFQIPAIHGKYEGQLSADGSSLDGFWSQGPPLALDFARVKSAGEQMLESRKRPARAPISLAQLKPVLDQEFASTLKDGLLSIATGGGVAIGVLDHGQRRIFSYGAARPDSIFEIASVTKTFTALALAQLVEQKKVTLDEPLRELLPPGTAGKPSGPEITLVDLATHHSGLPRLADNVKPEPDVDAFGQYSPADLRAFFDKHGVAAPVEPRYLYSNWGFSLLGYGLALREGKSYDQLVRSEVTAPLHMKDTAVVLLPDQDKRVMQAYNSAFEKFEHGAYDADMFAGAGGIKSTASDLLTYLAANLHPATVGRGAPPGSAQATMPSALTLEHQVRADIQPGLKIALAWMFNEKRRIYFHDGGAMGYSSHVQFEPARDRAIVVLYNRLDDTVGRGGFVHRIAENVDELLNGEPTARIDYLPEHERVVMAQALYTDRAIDGSYHCRVNAFALPAAAKDPFPLTGTGEMQLAADGTGNFTQGTWTHRIDVPGLKLNCELKLKSGTYSVNPDGTGSDETRWVLQPGKDASRCSSFFPAFRQVAVSRPQLIVTDKKIGTFYVTTISPIAMLGAACQK